MKGVIQNKKLCQCSARDLATKSFDFVADTLQPLDCRFADTDRGQFGSKTFKSDSDFEHRIRFKGLEFGDTAASVCSSNNEPFAGETAQRFPYRSAARGRQRRELFLGFKAPSRIRRRISS